MSSQSALEIQKNITNGALGDLTCAMKPILTLGSKSSTAFICFPIATCTRMLMLKRPTNSQNGVLVKRILHRQRHD